MTAYYNEHDPYCAEWLRNLIAAGHIAPGVVDERDIRDVRPNELTDYRQCHFFAGIGGWSVALRLAGWPDDRHVWTGSCPCQPFSAAGRRGGVADERHLWPHWFWIIGECRPSVVFGEQVASKDGLKWLDLVQADMEISSYAFGAADLCAAGVEAPHIRQRLGFVAYDERTRLEEQRQQQARGERTAAERSGALGGLDNAHGAPTAHAVSAGRLVDRSTGDAPSRLADADGWSPGAEREQRSWQHGQQPPHGGFTGPWRDAEWLPCIDNTWRPAKPGAFPLAHGVPDRVGKLRAYGNAIVPQVFAEFIAAYREALGEDGVVTLRQMLG